MRQRRERTDALVIVAVCGASPSRKKAHERRRDAQQFVRNLARPIIHTGAPDTAPLDADKLPASQGVQLRLCVGLQPSAAPQRTGA